MGEAGEIADIYKKGNFQGHEISEDDVKERVRGYSLVYSFDGYSLGS